MKVILFHNLIILGSSMGYCIIRLSTEELHIYTEINTKIISLVEQIRIINEVFIWQKDTG